jgi:hypothetical protein
MDITEHLVDGDIVGRNPADPREIAKGLKDVAREEVPDETTREAIEEESSSRYATAISDPRVLLCMQGVEERACDEIVRPDCKTE